jgi:energy-coupling factor transport system ATP-binding protein
MPDRIREAVEAVGMTGMERRLVRSLSGGELQRLSIACALVASPEVLVLDEPFSQLDSENAASLLQTLERLANPSRTIILVEHRQGPWQSLPTRELRLEGGRPGGGPPATDQPASHSAGSGRAQRGYSEPRVDGPRVDAGAGGHPRRRDTPIVIAERLAIGRSGRASESAAWAAPAIEGGADSGLTAGSSRGSRQNSRRTGRGEAKGSRRGTVAADLEISVNPGDACAVVGPNGSGKSTLLWTLCGALPPAGGTLTVGGLDLSRRRKRRALQRRGAIRLVPQEAEAAFLKSTLREELGSLGCSPESIAPQLAVAGLQHRLDDAPQKLSVGQMKFFAVIAASGASPELLLLDEPTAALDRRLVPVVVAAIRASLAAGTAVVAATHDHELLDTEGLFKHTLELGPHADREWTRSRTRES